MLRWEFYIYEKNSSNRKLSRHNLMLASCISYSDNLDWVKNLLISNNARIIDDENYPFVFIVKASLLLPDLYVMLSENNPLQIKYLNMPSMLIIIELNAGNIFLCSNTDEIAIEIWKE